MTNKIKMTNKVFKGDTINEAEDKASEWAKCFLREDYRVAWVGRDLMFNVDCFVVVSEGVE
jgi:hypothetical protein